MPTVIRNSAATKGAEAANKAGLDTVEVTGVNNSINTDLNLFRIKTYF